MPPTLLWALFFFLVPDEAAWGYPSMLAGDGYIWWSLLLLPLIFPGVGRRFAPLLSGTSTQAPPRWQPWAVGALFGALCLAFPVRNLLLGDGLLITEMIDKGIPFRIFDGLDYQAHRLLARITDRDAASVYRATSTLGGFLLVPAVYPLLGRLGWEAWRRRVFVGLLLTTAPVLFFFGYVESYTWLYLALTLYLVAGLAAIAGHLSPVWPSVLFGLAMALNLTAVFSLPPLLYMVFRPQPESWLRRVRNGLGPAFLLVAVAVLAQVVAGYDGQWWARDFRPGAHALNLWRDDLLSPRHLSDLKNLAWLMGLAPMLVVTFLYRRWFRSPGSVFLIIQVAGLALLHFLLEPKLGLPRDWDLLAAHQGGLLLLAARLLPRNGGKTGLVVLGFSLLMVMPWVTLSARPEASRQWLLSGAEDDEPSARAHLYADSAQLLRRNGDMAGALAMYEECVAADPHNPRHYQLRAAAAIALAREQRDDPEACDALLARAEKDLRHYLEKRPDSPRAREDLQRVQYLRRSLKNPAPPPREP